MEKFFDKCGKKLSESVMEVKRNYYLNQLISRKDNGLIKIVTGLRRCGKSYLLFELYKNYLTENGD